MVGRELEVVELAELVGRRWLVTLTGAPGVGKSCLARELATVLSPRGSGVAVVALGAVRGAGAVASAVAQALAVEDLSPEALAAAATGGRRWVLLDDCDEVSDAAAEVARALGAAGLGVLATSQRSLVIDGETPWRVRPLSVPSSAWIASPDVRVDSEALRLFCERAAEVHREFALTAETAPAVGAICRCLDGLPLAIEAAARYIDMLSPVEILARLEENPVAVLSATHRGQRSLWMAVETSYERLSARERLLWARLSVFAGGFGLPAAQAVCAGDELGSKQVFETLAGLVAASVVEAETTRSPSRYRLLEPLRDYARRRSEDTDEAGALAAAHGRWCLELVEQAGDPGQGRPWVKRLAPDHANIASAWCRALAAEEAESAVGLVRAHAYLCRADGRHHEARSALEQTCPQAAAAAGAGERNARTLWEAGGAAAVIGASDTATAHLDDSVAVARTVGDVAAEARALALAGMVATVRGEHGGDLAPLEQTVALARSADDESCLIDALAAAGRAHLLVGQPTQARAYFAESLTRARRGDDSDIADLLVGAGQGALAQGDYQEAQASHSVGLALATESSEVHTQAVALAGLGELSRIRGESTAAKRHFGQCARLAREAATPYPLSLALLGLGRLALAEDAPAARAWFEQTLAIARESTLVHVIPSCLVGMAQVAAAGDDAQGAARLLAKALRAARRCRDKAGEAQALREMGRMALVAGDPERAASRHHQALVLDAEIGDPAGIADSLQALAGPAASRGRHTAAARLLGATHTLRSTHGCVPAAREQCEYDVYARSARDGAGGEAFETAWAQGAALSREEAIAEASKGRGPRRRPAKGWEALTPAERRVVALVREGLSNAQIAGRLLISRRTVDAHLAHIFAKLGIHSRIELITGQRRPGSPHARS